MVRDDPRRPESDYSAGGPRVRDPELSLFAPLLWWLLQIAVATSVRGPL